MSLISVIIPSYQQERFLLEAIDSVLAQTHVQFEIIVIVDGASPDQYGKLLNKIKSHQDKITVAFVDHGGVAASRNKGLALAKGEYIAFLDDDDLWEPTFLMQTKSLLEAHEDLAFVYGDTLFVDEHGQPMMHYMRQTRILNGRLSIDLFCDYFLMVGTMLIRRKAIDAIGLMREDLVVGEDYEFFLRLSQHFDAGVIKEKFFHRRVRSDSLSRKDYGIDAEINLLTLKTFLCRYPDFDREYRSRINQRLSQWHFDYAYWLRQKGRLTQSWQESRLAWSYQPQWCILKNMLMLFLLSFRRKD